MKKRMSNLMNTKENHPASEFKVLVFHYWIVFLHLDCIYIPNPSKLLSAHSSIKLEFPGPSLQCTSPISTMRKQLSTSTSSPHALPRMLLGFHDSGGPGGTGPSLVLQQRGRTSTDVAWQESIVKNHSFWVKLETIYKNICKFFVQSIDL